MSIGCEWLVPLEYTTIFQPSTELLHTRESPLFNPLMFIQQTAPTDVDCGRNLDLLIQALPRIEDPEERQRITNRALGLIRQSHPSWNNSNSDSDLAWDLFLSIADFSPQDIGIQKPESTTGKYQDKSSKKKPG